MNSPATFTIRTMRRDEIDLAIAWAAAEGWNPGVHDAQSFYAADPEGFLIGYLDEEPVGCISVVAYGEGFGFLGLYIVRPAFRGKGYGLALWQSGMARLAGRNVGLDGVPAQQENYRQSGFHFAYRNIRFEGAAPTSPPSTLAPGLVKLADVPFDLLCAYDDALFPAARRQFLRGWIAQPDAIGFASMDGDRLSGYGVLRPCLRGYKIGPLFADSPETADMLFHALSGAAAGGPVFLDVPEPNREALVLAERHRMSRVFETARMYTGPAPAVPIDRVFGVTSFELG